MELTATLLGFFQLCAWGVGGGDGFRVQGSGFRV